MRTIVIFGDALTWGYDPSNIALPIGSKIRRFSDEERWPGVLAAELGDGYRFIVEGLSGRTTVWDDPLEPGRCGAAHLIPVLDSHSPVDLVIIMLGTNDLKHHLGLGARDIARGAGILVDQALHNAAKDFVDEPRVLLISPPHLGDNVENLPGDPSFVDSLAKSKRLAAQFKIVADRYQVTFFDAATVAKPSPIDQVHLDADQHANLGRAIAPVVRQMLED